MCVVIVAATDEAQASQQRPPELFSIAPVSAKVLFHRYTVRVGDGSVVYEHFRDVPAKAVIEPQRGGYGSGSANRASLSIGQWRRNDVGGEGSSVDPQLTAVRLIEATGVLRKRTRRWCRRSGDYICERRAALAQ